MPPGPPVAPQILPRQPGETDYAYRKRRSVALTGETPYQRRIRLGRARGISTTEARGQRPGESVRRRERVFAQTGFTPSQLYRQSNTQWLIDNGFTPETTGWSWSRLIRIAPRLRYMNNQASPGAQITPFMLADAIDLEDAGEIQREWTWERINEKYNDVYELREHGNKQPGRFHYFRDVDMQSYMPVAWWYYH
jgi:hypothetical protein